MLFSLVPKAWSEVLAPHEDRINSIGRELQQRADKGERILPDRKWVFRSLEMPPENVKVVIVGQDPYPNISDAVGLAFSVAPRKSGLPGSLMNIQKEIITDIGSTTTSDGDLSRWSSQGVMLLNRILTVTAGESASHAALGWGEVTESIIAHVAGNGAIGVLWGNSAKEVAPLFPEANRIEGIHPSPLSAHRGFLGSKPFSRVNERLLAQGREPIIW
jgi:uracil-DNA glycosylase